MPPYRIYVYRIVLGQRRGVLCPHAGGTKLAGSGRCNRRSDSNKHKMKSQPTHEQSYSRSLFVPPCGDFVRCQDAASAARRGDATSAHKCRRGTKLTQERRNMSDKKRRLHILVDLYPDFLILPEEWEDPTDLAQSQLSEPSESILIKAWWESDEQGQ